VGEVRGVEHWVAAEFERNIVGPIEDFQDPRQEWRRLVGPIAGAALAVAAAFVLRGPGGGLAGSAAAQGGLFTEAALPDKA
jgi:hypothetical protein